MARAKLQLAYIKNKNARESTIKKRKRGLIKKFHELSTLCGVECCVVIYSPSCPEPDVWPYRLATEHVIARYQDMPSFQKSNKMADQETFAKQALAKVDEQLMKMQKENRLTELSIMMNNDLSNNRVWLQNLDDSHLTYVYNYVLKPQLEDMERKIVMFNQELSGTHQEQ